MLCHKISCVIASPLHTWRKLNIHKRPGRLLNVLYTLSLRLVSWEDPAIFDFFPLLYLGRDHKLKLRLFLTFRDSKTETWLNHFWGVLQKPITILKSAGTLQWQKVFMWRHLQGIKSTLKWWNFTQKWLFSGV